MEIGRLNSRVQIQSFSEQQDNTYRTYKTWTTIKTVWADIQPVKGAVTFDSQQLEVQISHKIFIRYQPFITSEHWILFDNRRFRIRSVRNLQEMNRFTELLCEEEFIALHNFEADIDAVENPLRDLLE